MKVLPGSSIAGGGGVEEMAGGGKAPVGQFWPLGLTALVGGGGLGSSGMTDPVTVWGLDMVRAREKAV